MTVSEVENRVAAIAAEAHDDETAHAAEDALWESVLRHIASGKANDPQRLALAALETTKIGFQRWCA